METKKEIKIFAWLLVFFLAAYFLPIGETRFDNAIYQALELTKWYAREHVLLCLIPAFFIAGVIAVFISQASVIKYFGAKANKVLAYLVASVSGTILAVCSCTILPLFSSIHKRGAGLGPAIAFLYSGPAINILAIILTARILGWELGLARVIGAVIFSLVIGLLMAFIFKKEEKIRTEAQMNVPDVPETRPMWQTSTHFFILVFILVFANWGTKDIFGLSKWHITAFFGVAFMFSLVYILKMKWQHVALAALPAIVSSFVFSAPEVPFILAVAGLVVLTLTKEGEPREWLFETWGFTKQILPLLAAGVLVAGLLLGSESGEGLIPNQWVASLVGGNSLFSNLFASVFGAFMYFATLTEVPILQGLIASGMGQGPALALLLAGPALSLPNMLVIHSVMGFKKTATFILLVIIMATISGLIFGSFYS